MYINGADFKVVAGGIHITTALETIPQNFEQGSLKPIYKCNHLFSGADIVSLAYDFLEKDKYLYVNREIDAVLQDIRAVKSKHVMLIDDNFVGNCEWTKEFLVAIHPLKI